MSFSGRIKDFYFFRDVTYSWLPRDQQRQRPLKTTYGVDPLEGYYASKVN